MNTKQLKDLFTALESLSSVVTENGPGLSVDSHWEIGKAYYLRTVTHIITGRLCAISKTELVLDQSAWIADTGRYADAMFSGVFSEIEPYPVDWKVIVNRAALIDATQWPHKLPYKQK